MSDYKVTKTGENEYKVEKESDWSSDDLEGTSFCIVCGKRFVPLWEGDRCCSLECKCKYDENEEYYDEKEKSGTFFSCFVFLALLAFFVYCAVTCVNEAKTLGYSLIENVSTNKNVKDVILLLFFRTLRFTQVLSDAL